MSVYGMFTPSALGMRSHSHAINTIGFNIANVNTGGYKKTQTHFETVLSRTVANQSRLDVQSDLAGVIPKDFVRVSTPGRIESSARALDVSIQGKGFFILNTQIDGSGEPLYGRDGSFNLRTGDDITVTGLGGIPIQVNEGYLVDKNGLYVQGWAKGADGTFPDTAASLQSLRIDPFVFTDTGSVTTRAALSVNLPADNAVGDLETYAIDVFDDTGLQQSLLLRFTKADLNTWGFGITGDPGDVITVSPSTAFSASVAGSDEAVFDSGAGTITIQDTATMTPTAGFFTGLNAGDTLTVTGTALNNGSFTIASVSPDGSQVTIDTAATPLGGNETDITGTDFSTPGFVAQALQFTADGVLIGPLVYDFTVDFAGGGSVTFPLDLTETTQFASQGDLIPFNFFRDGFARSDLRSVRFDREGHIIATFDSGREEEIYKLGLGVFTNPDGLEVRNGNVYAESLESGQVSVETASSDSVAQFAPNSLEVSNVDLGDELTKLITTQTAYELSSTVFRTVDEMTEVARDLKR